MADRNIEIWLPMIFYQDHIERDLPGGEWITSSNNARALIRCTSDELDEIMNDAQYYADKDGPDDVQKWLKDSAKRTVRAIAKYRSA